MSLCCFVHCSVEGNENGLFCGVKVAARTAAHQVMAPSCDTHDKLCFVAYSQELIQDYYEGVATVVGGPPQICML